MQREIETSRRDFLKLAGVSAGAALLAPVDPPTLSVGRVGAVRMAPYRVGKWLPSDQAFLDRWLAERIREVEENPQPLHPVVQEFQDLIESDAQLYMYFNQMFEELPRSSKFLTTPIGTPQVRDYRQMLALISGILTTAPVFNKTGLVGFPINAILNWPMGTENGFAAFLDPRVNAQIKKILDTWAVFLSSRASRYVLSDDPESGWFGRDAMEAMPGFTDTFQCEPDQPYYGFTSWDDFFTRQFRDGQRPVAAPEDPGVIVNACESAPYKLATDVKWMDRFWIKGQTLFAAPHVRRRSGCRAVRRGHSLPGLPQRPQLSPLAQPGQRHNCEGRDH